MKNLRGAKILKNINRKKILEKIVTNKNISRSEISKLTGLNKATVSEQIATLIEENLVIEQQSTESHVGRKPIILSLNGAAGYAIGLDLNANCLSSILTDLNGTILIQEKISFENKSFEYLFNILCKQIQKLIDHMPPSEYGLIGIGLGIHSIVDTNCKIVYDPNFKWENINLKSKLEDLYNVDVLINNNNNLCAYAEKTFFTNTDNLICISLSSGIGSGIYINNKIYMGYKGFAGEIGHMIVVPNGKPCPCGNNGCWEQYASEKSFLKQVSDLKGITNCSSEDVKALISQNDPIIIEAYKDWAMYLFIGLNNIINIFNPAVIIINSHLVSLYPELIHILNKSLISSMNHYSLLTTSSLGENSCCLGATALCVNKFLHISNINLINEADNDID